ncbi:hypothetical protein SAWG_01858 [Staphylococcus aureus subsp. aureus M899]|nr:hypothetical protein SAWG_01858 [Staphylococcus aureus subsp. aureus M899]
MGNGSNIVKSDFQFLQTLQVGERVQHRSWRKVSFCEYNKKAR